MTVTTARVRVGRRRFIVSALTALGASASCRPAGASESALVPDGSQLEPGDLLWPKHPDTQIPYRGAYVGEEARWERERDDFVAALRRRPDATTEDLARARALENTRFREFEALYFGDQPPGPVPLGTMTHYVGHVGIVYMRKPGEPSVVEAVVPYVRILAYKEWLADRRGHQAGEYVWQGRLAGVGATDRARAAAIAAGYVGQPYRFFNLELQNDAGFYCSKLVWLAVKRATGLEINDRGLAWPQLWFSPKQLMSSSRVCLVLNPAPYALDARACATS